MNTVTASSSASRSSEESSNSSSPLTPRGTRDHGSSSALADDTRRQQINSSLQNAPSAILNYFKEQYFLVGLGVVIAIASQHQVPRAQQDFKETVVNYFCVSLIFLITGCTLPSKVLLENYSRWKIHLFVQAQCFLMTSATAFGVVSAAAINRNFMDPGLLIGMIFTGTVPTTISSNVVLTRQANGNTALTVVQSTIGNLVAPFITPLLITMYTSTHAWYTDFLPENGDDYGAIYSRVFKQLGLSIFLPLVRSLRVDMNLVVLTISRSSGKPYRICSQTLPRQS